MDLYKRMIRGRYRAKQKYAEIVDKNDDENEEDENEVTYKNLNNNEQDIINIIDKSRNSLNKKLKSLKKYSKGDDDFLIHSTKEHGDYSDFLKAEKFFSSNDILRLIEFAKVIFQIDRNLKTFEDSEKIIKYDCILVEINLIALKHKY